MRAAWPAIRNVLKAWVLLLGLCAALGALGWWIGGLRVASVFGFCGLLVGLGCVLVRRPRRRWEWSARASCCPARRRSSRPSVEQLSLRARVVKPRLYVIPDGFPRALSVGSRRDELVDRGQHGPPRLAGAGRGRGSASRTRSRTSATGTCWSRRRRSCSPARWSSSRGSAAGSHARCSTSSGRWRRRSCICCCRRGASSRPTGWRPQLCESPHGLADALVRLDQASELVQFQASPATEPLYTINPFAEEGLARLFVTHPPVGERVQPAARPRSGLAREARSGLETTKGRTTTLAAAFRKIIRRRPTLPGGCPPSTIGAGGLNCSVRNGKRCTPAAMTTGNCEGMRVNPRPPSKLHSDISVFEIKTSGN